MELENKITQTQAQNGSSFSDVSVVRQSENASVQGGFISVAYVISWSEFNKETSEEIGFEQEKREWCGSLSELKSKLEDLRKSADSCGCSLSDCRVSLAEYAEPELKSENISEIKSLFLRIFNNGKFYFKTQEEAKEFFLEHCHSNGIPTPNEIQYVIDGYYIKWNFEQGFSGSEVSLWKFIQKFLHGIFVKLGSDASICQDATAMLYASGFSTVFDPCEKTSIIFSNDENYASPIEFLSKLPLNFSEIADYEKAKKIVPLCAKIYKDKRNYSENRDVEKIIAQNEEKRIIKEPDVTERAKLFSEAFTDALKDEKCVGEQYRYYQHRATGDPKKFYKWLEINSGEKILPNFDPESYGWLSAATYYSRFRRKSNVASIDCNFLVIKWKDSELRFIPAQEQGKELVLSRCHELGLPEPKIVSTPDGLEIKWFWNDRMSKILYANDPYNSRFNDGWDAVQKKLFEKFWYFGADAKKICATTMFSIPGSKDTRKTLKSDDRIIREIHNGETVESYRNIQRALGLKETFENEQPEVFDEILEQKWQKFSEENSELVKEWLADVLKIHQAGQNWVCFGFIDEQGNWNNRWVKAFEIRKFLMNLVRKPEFHDCDFYVSQGEFFDRNDRHVEDLASIKAAFVDLDYKVLVEYRPKISENPTPEKWEELVKAHCEKFKIPLPNDMVFSGGGVHVKWIFEEVVSRAELELWQYAQKLLLEQFKTLGADPQSSDGARVLRLVGTLNHKENSIVKDRNVRVIDREFFSKNKISFREFLDGLEKSQPENADDFDKVKADWQRTLAQLSIREAAMLRPDSEMKIDFESPEFKRADEYYWLENTLRHHKLHATYIAAEISGVTKWIETYQLHQTLRMLYGTPNLKLSLSELKSPELAEKKEALEWIPCNYVVLSRCTGETVEEQKENIFARCHEYRGRGIPEPNQIIKIGKTLLVEWTYQSVLIYKALSRWQMVQEFLCRHFEDWGAMDNPEYLKATALLPVPGFVYDGETVRLEYSDLGKLYTFHRLANAVLNFSQKEVEEYRKQKASETAKREAKRKITPKVAVSEKAIEKLKAKNPAAKFKFADWKTMALMRYMDIIKFLDLQREADGEIPQNTRELCCFWALVFARQAGLLKTYEEFKAKAEELIKFCGIEFMSECFVATLKSAFTKHYSAKTDTLISKLRITPEYQKQMKVLCYGIRTSVKKRQPRAEWLAEHSQEREKPWEKMGFSRAKYFNLKRLGMLPEIDNIFVKNSGHQYLDWSNNIMSARALLCFLVRYFELMSFILSKKLRVFVFSAFTLNYSAQSWFLSLLGFLYCRDFRIRNLITLFFLKRRVIRPKRKRKRQSGWRLDGGLMNPCM
ncbi:MAG: hypothetical protein IJ859_08030 [Synergistaceae bacterium]|nr:hypothetical protein [Synergistaceae bacterium]